MMKYSGDVKQEMENGYELLVTSNDDVKIKDRSVDLAMG